MWFNLHVFILESWSLQGKVRLMLLWLWWNFTSDFIWNKSSNGNTCRLFTFQVAEGQEVCVLEAMKMQNSLVAAKTGKVGIISFFVCIFIRLYYTNLPTAYSLIICWYFEWVSGYNIKRIILFVFRSDMIKSFKRALWTF